MDASVRQFEPQMALFAAENGLVMYRKIADQAKKLLTPDGKIFVEIGFQQGKSVQRILQKLFQIKKLRSFKIYLEKIGWSQYNNPQHVDNQFFSKNFLIKTVIE